jgi:inorganic pyrophosphatase
MAKKQAKHLADPKQLKPVESKDGTLQVIIETPKSSRNKYAYDTKQKIFSLTKVLPAGMAFPMTSDSYPKRWHRMEMRSMYCC